MRPLTLERPKPMLPVAGSPILFYLLTWLREQGIADVAINLHYQPAAIVDTFGDGAALGLRLIYSAEDALLGSAGALRPLAGFLGRGSFVAVYGDTLTTLPLTPLIELHDEVRPAVTMAVMEHPRPTEAGIVELVDRRPWHRGEAGRVIRLVEKPRPEQLFSTIANAGIFVFAPEVLNLVPPQGPADIARDLLPAVLARGGLVAAWRVPADAVIWDVGTMASYERAQLAWPPAWASRSRPA